MRAEREVTAARLDRADAVLDTVAAVCFTTDVPFKHLTSEMTFIFSHHKHGTRSQAGKFCAIYPPDEATARHLLEELSERLRDEEGPYVLSDRRYRDSRTVHYRYGAFRTVSRIRPDGTPEHLVRDGTGQLVEDVRTNRFVLPEAVTDPFAVPPSVPAPDVSADEGVWIGEYRVLRALAQSNAGGAYQAVAPDGTTVFMKEARAHNGLDWERSTAQQRLRHEHRVLTDLHAEAPGLAPQPLAYFREWEHDFLVTELVPGEPLARLLTRRNPYIQASTEGDFVAYFAECRRILSSLEAILDRLHRAGYRFGDLNPRNILVTEDGQVRLIDFESCGRLDEPPIIMGVPGFAPARRDQWEGTRPDEYGLAAIAFGLVMPVHQFALLHPPALDHLYTDARRQGYEVPAELWRVAVRNFIDSDRRPSGPDITALPTPEEVATDPVRHLRWLREALGRDLTTEVAPDDPYRMYPTVPQGHLTNTLCVAFGAAGVLHALHHASLPIDERVVDRLRREAVAEHAKPLPPGLHYGAAGIGWVLAELGHLDEAVDLVAAAESHPALAYTGGSGVGRGDLGVGTAGIGAARLALSALTGDPRHVEEAARIGDDLCRAADMVPLVGPRNAIGLLHGRAGIALFLYHLWRATGDKRYLHRGTALLHEELDRDRDARRGTRVQR
jgi:tRNA A-37 threonylcarbamoyl transferase component Bud32